VELTGANAATRLCAVTTICFDIAALEIFMPACVGATLVVATEGTTADPAALAALLKEQSVNMMQATPTTWRQGLTLVHVRAQLEQLQDTIIN
jgi:non-ribosomal peptide synthetase component F